ncbi:MAG: putative addiction module antidote protein [Omnitrophica bacterium RIFCSPLOWO2_12_FULL_50_11]|nr:MAG: putative addiction module antidote protein [Omnitrophica bacterium RIFCSPLOWO2_12_FULL_50_11]
MKRKSWVRYQDLLIEDLKDPEEAAGYLNAVLAEGDQKMFLVALRNVAEAHGGMLKLSRKTRLSRPNLYRMFSRNGHPEIQSIHRVLAAFDLNLRVSPKEEKSAGLKKAA